MLKYCFESYLFLIRYTGLTVGNMKMLLLPMKTEEVQRMEEQIDVRIEI